MGGLWARMPIFSVFFLFFALASMGLPGLNNFVGEILLLVGIFEARPLIGILSFGGLIFTVIYILRMVKDTLFGEPKTTHAWVDVNAREVVILVIMALPILFIGLHPGPALRLLEQPVQHLLSTGQLPGPGQVMAQVEPRRIAKVFCSTELFTVSR